MGVRRGRALHRGSPYSDTVPPGVGRADDNEEKRKELRRRALAHPIRREILGRLSGAELSRHEVREALGGETLSVVGYHLGVLERAGLVRGVGGLYRLP